VGLSPESIAGQGVKTNLFIPRQFFQIGFNFTDLMSDDAFQMTQIVKDLTFEVDFGTIALADLIQLIDNVAQIRANFLNLFIPLAYAICDNGLTLARVFKLDAFGEELAFVFLKIDFQNVVVSFLPQAIAIDLIRVGNAKTFQIIVHNGTFDIIITFE
jgi:hypothetical protein